MAGKTQKPTTEELLAAAAAERDATVRAADKELADAMHAVHVARATRDQAVAKAEADFAEAVKAATAPAAETSGQ